MTWHEDVRVSRAGLVRRGLTLVGLAVVVGGLALVGVLPVWPGLVHHVALPPLDLFADVRLLMAIAPTWWLFALGLVASVLVRIGVLTLLLGDPSRAGLRVAVALYAIATPPALLAGWSTWAAHAALYSGLHWIGVGLALVAAVGLAAAPWAGRQTAGSAPAGLRAGLRASWAHGLRAGAVLVYVAALTAAGGLATIDGAVVTVLAVPVSAALTLGAITWLARPPASPKLARALAATAAAVVLGGAVLVVTAGEPGPVATDTARTDTLLAMSGMNSASGEGAVLEVDHPNVFGYDCERVYYVSYTGPGDGQPQGEAVCPIRTGAPYTEQDTRLQSFEEQVDNLAAQVEELPRPITLIAHSQGAWVAWEAAAAGRLDGVHRLIVIGPFPDGPLGYPPGGSAGPGRIGADVLRLVQPLTDLIGFTFHPDEPLASDVLAPANRPRGIYEQPLPEAMRGFSVTGIGDLAIKPGGWRLTHADDGCPSVAPHPDLPLDADVQRQINAFLDGEEPPPCPTWRLLVHPIGLAWSPPPASESPTDGRGVR